MAREPKHADFARVLEANIEWCRRNEVWWRPTKDATEARYVELGAVGERRLTRWGVDMVS